MQPLSVGTVAWRPAGDIELMTWPFLTSLGVDVAMTTRAGGVSTGAYDSLNLGLHVGDDDRRVVENRRRAAAAFGARLDDVVFADQTHGRDVAVVAAADAGRGARSLETAVPGVDALVTAEPGVVLAMMVADCVPIALYAPGRRLAGAVHAGWRGTLRRVAAAAVDAMTALGAEAGDIVAAVGPAVDPDQYEVGPEVVDAARACFGDDLDGIVTAAASPGSSTTWRLDLWEANRRILFEAGLRPEHVLVAGVPTGGDGPFFSHRAVQPCGRNALFVRLPAAS